MGVLPRSVFSYTGTCTDNGARSQVQSRPYSILFIIESHVRRHGCRSSSGSNSQALSNLELSVHTLSHHSSTADGYKAAASSASTPQPSKPYSRALQWLADRAETTAALGHSHVDGLVDRGLRSLRECVPMPCFVVRRRSALRVRLHWHGFTQPVAKPRAVQTCEVYL